MNIWMLDDTCNFTTWYVAQQKKKVSIGEVFLNIEPCVIQMNVCEAWCTPLPTWRLNQIWVCPTVLIWNCSISLVLSVKITNYTYIVTLLWATHWVRLPRKESQKKIIKSRLKKFDTKPHAYISIERGEFVMMCCVIATNNAKCSILWSLHQMWSKLFLQVTMKEGSENWWQSVTLGDPAFKL